MSNDMKKTVLESLTEPITDSAKNIIEKPTQNMGTTLADIWYLVFGGISYAADKRKLTYTYALQKFEDELKKQVEKIKEEDRKEPDIQIVAPALEAAKYCVEKEELRTLFARLIAASLDKWTCDMVHPLFPHIIKRMSSSDAKLFLEISKHSWTLHPVLIPISYGQLVQSILTLENLGLIFSDYKEYHFCSIDRDGKRSFYVRANDSDQIIKVFLTQIGEAFYRICC